jgi:hypothetical protein
MSNLYQASAQWSTRPADQRFWTIEDAHQFCKGYADTASENVIDFGRASLVQHNGNLALSTGHGSQPLTMTHWSFGQLARMAGAPAEYLRKLPAPLAAQCLESGLDNHFKGRDEFDKVGLVHGGETPVVRALTSDKYTRFWNHQVFDRLGQLQSQGWRVPPARPSGMSDVTRVATEDDCLDVRMAGLGIKPGDLIAPAGIYASDHDMFAFMVNEDVRISDGTDGGLSRGFFISNSEVGASALKMTLFYYRHVCGNHIVWGAENVLDVNVRHIGDVEGRFTVEVEGSVGKYLAASAKEDESRIRRAKEMILGKNATELLDGIFQLTGRKRRHGLPDALNLQIVDVAIEQAEQHPEDGNPLSLWGFAQGLTRVSQSYGWADRRNAIDAAAGQLLALAV